MRGLGLDDDQERELGEALRDALIKQREAERNRTAALAAGLDAALAATHGKPDDEEKDE